MLSNHLQNGIETARLAWSRLPNAEEGEQQDIGLVQTSDGSSSVESLDYEVVENYAYWEEQVFVFFSVITKLCLKKVWKIRFLRVEFCVIFFEMYRHREESSTLDIM